LPDPTGDPNSDVIVKSFLGTPEMTASLMDGEPVVMSPIVQIRLKYPGAQLAGRHTLKFLVTTQSGGVNAFEFGYVEVQ